MNEKKEIREIIAAIDTARERLESLISRSDEQDAHQIIVIGVAAIVPNNAFADSLIDDISAFVEQNTEAEILEEEREMR